MTHTCTCKWRWLEKNPKITLGGRTYVNGSRKKVGQYLSESSSTYKKNVESESGSGSAPNAADPQHWHYYFAIPDPGFCRLQIQAEIKMQKSLILQLQ